MTLILTLVFIFLVFIAAMVCALTNFVIRQQEVALEPTVEDVEEE